jgi:hypothetical protein
MSEFTAISSVTQTLKELLEAHITKSTEPLLKGVPIDLRTPREMRRAHNALGVSLWLYRVSRHGDLVNRPPQRPEPGKTLRHPLPIDLYYLVTPISKEPKDEQALMGRVLQVFNDHPVLRGSDLRDDLKGSGEELRLIMDGLSLDEMSRVWVGLQDSYQLSVAYIVQVVTIDSGLEPVEASPVVARESEYGQIVAVS